MLGLLITLAVSVMMVKEFGRAESVGFEHSPDWEEDCLHWWGRILTGEHCHWCPDWDDLPINEECEEYLYCSCYDKEKKMDVLEWIKGMAIIGTTGQAMEEYPPITGGRTITCLVLDPPITLMNTEEMDWSLLIQPIGTYDKRQKRERKEEHTGCDCPFCQVS